MSKDKPKVNSTEVKATETPVSKPKEDKPKMLTIAGLVKGYADASKTFKDKEALVAQVQSDMKAAGQEKNVRGHPLVKAKVLSQCNAIMRDIMSGKKGWWSQYKVEEDKDVLKITKKV